MPPRKRRPLASFDRPHLILTEGPGDAAFFRFLLAQRLAPDTFHVQCPQDSEGTSGSGKTRFTEALDGFAVLPGFDNLTGILVVADNDSDPSESFEFVRHQIAKTSRAHRAPTAPLVKADGTPPFTVLMVPWTGEVGSLETVYLPAAASVRPETTACVDTFETCVGSNTWPPTKSAKARLRYFIASQNQRNPDEGLLYLWDRQPELIPLDHICFDRIANFLLGFEAFLEAK